MIKFIAVLTLILSFPLGVNGEILKDPRYCGEPERYDNGIIKRNRTLIKNFEELYPLPEGADRGEWSVDHVIPLAVGGCDSLINLQWLPNSIKSTGDGDNKDRWERTLYDKNFYRE